jgi:hypothetical protein
MCCNWWKRKVYPLYELQEEAYRDVGEMLKQMKGSVLNLRVVDNCLD